MKCHKQEGEGAPGTMDLILYQYCLKCEQSKGIYFTWLQYLGQSWAPAQTTKATQAMCGVDGEP